MQRVVLSCPGVTDKKWGIFDAVKNGVAVVLVFGTTAAAVRFMSRSCHGMCFEETCGSLNAQWDDAQGRAGGKVEMRLRLCETLEKGKGFAFRF